MKLISGRKWEGMACILIILLGVMFVNADDLTPPEIKNVSATPSIAWEGEMITISCTVTDDVGVDIVKVVIKYPDGSIANMTMLKTINNQYIYKQTYSIIGTYIYYIWAKDTSGNTNTSANYTFLVKEDTSSPTTYCILTGTEGENEWFISDVTITLYTTDIGTGVEYIMYALDDGPWLVYHSSFTVEEEGSHIVYYYAKDKAGNNETIKYMKFKIDKTLPTTECNLYGTIGENGWYITNVSISLTANDEISGVNKTYYKIDCGKWKIYNDTIVISENGKHVIYFYSVDMAGNREKNKTEIFKIDKTTPTVTIVKPKEGYLYIEDREIMPTITGNTVIIGKITIEVDAINGESGIEKVEFYIDNMYQTEDKQAPYQWTWDYLSLGTHIIKTVAYDIAGNYAEDEMIVKIFNI